MELEGFIAHLGGVLAEHHRMSDAGELSAGSDRELGWLDNEYRILLGHLPAAAGALELAAPAAVADRLHGSIRWALELRMASRAARIASRSARLRLFVLRTQILARRGALQAGGPGEIRA
jgi:hypothetical protein